MSAPTPDTEPVADLTTPAAREHATYTFADALAASRAEFKGFHIDADQRNTVLVKCHDTDIGSVQRWAQALRLGEPGFGTHPLDGAVHYGVAGVVHGARWMVWCIWDRQEATS